VFGGTPTTARGTHALPIHLSALIRIRGSHSLANHSSALFFCPIRVHPGLSVVEFPGLRLAAPGLPSRKNRASRKYHNIRQLQQTKTDIRHQGKTKTANISLFFSGRIPLEKIKNRLSN
jgi:hypothetical protein